VLIDFRQLIELFSQAHLGNDADLIFPVHVAQQHCHNSHDATYCECYSGEPVWRPGDLEAKVQIP